MGGNILNKIKVHFHLGDIFMTKSFLFRWEIILQALLVFKHCTRLTVLVALHVRSVGTRLVTEPTGTNKFRRDNYYFHLIFRGPCIVSIFLLIYFQRRATLRSLFLEKFSTCFGWYLHPSSGAHTTVFIVSGTC